jgi:hypothetical protein
MSASTHVAKYIKDDDGTFFARANKLRNLLLHGEEIPAIEKTLGVDFSKEVDKLGQLAWTAILNRFTSGFGGHRPSLLQVSSYVHMKLTSKSHMQFGFTPNFENPDPDHLPAIEMTMISRSASSDHVEEITHHPIGTRPKPD